MDRSTTKIITGDARAVTLKPGSVQAIITSPPYFRKRNYMAGEAEIGKEDDPDRYVSELAGVFEHLRDALHDTGVAWVNLGDTRNGSGGAGGDYAPGGKRAGQPRYKGVNVKGLARRNLLGIPYRFAFEMQKRGWVWLADCVWYKLPGLPESCNDRPNHRHESFLMFAKTPKPYYNKRRVKEYGAHGWESVWSFRPRPYSGAHTAAYHPDLVAPIIVGSTPNEGVCAGCGAPMIEERTLVSTGEPERYTGQARKDYHTHRAPDPSDTKRRILASMAREHIYTAKPSCTCNAGLVPATVLDPFAGAGNTGVAAKRLGRSFVGIELNPGFAEEARRNIRSA